MTYKTVTDSQTTFDLPLQAAREHIAALQASATPPPSPTSAPPRRGPLAITRDAVGTRLVGLGRALIADEALRRRVVGS